MFGGEFVDMKIVVETLRGIRYKLRMMGVPIIHNTQIPVFTLKKKSNYICYHTVRESVLVVGYLTVHIGTN